MQFSHSRVECFEKCKYRFNLRYNEQLDTIRTDAPPDDPLILGHALHTGIEKGVEAGVAEYLNAFPVITDQHINEQIKLEYLIPKVLALLPEGENEVMLSSGDFLGFIDYLAPVKLFHDSIAPNLYDIYDFKYTSNGSRYLESDQLHLYKYWFERLNPGKKVRNLTYVIIPKVNIKQKKTETLLDFRRRIQAELRETEVELLPVDYNPEKVAEWYSGIKAILECTDFVKNPSYLCKWCEYVEYCKGGLDYMVLPKNERRTINAITKKVVWLYGAPFSGKTFFANAFPAPLMLNTDGNIRYVDAPFIPIRDNVEVNGRLTKKTLAWEVFKEVIAELEKKQNDFRTIVVDLLEDCYESCRLWMYNEMGITHESDDSFKAWDKVRTEFLSTMRRLVNLDYENIVLISHEDMSRDITKKGNDKITAIKPNIQDKVATKIAGMVDIVARVVADDNNRVLSFKNSEVIFGGGRLTVSAKEIPLDYAAFVEVYNEANKNAAETLGGRNQSAPEQPNTNTPEPEKPVTVASSAPEDDSKAEEPAQAEEQSKAPDPEPAAPAAEPEAPKPRSRRRREQ